MPESQANMTGYKKLFLLIFITAIGIGVYFLWPFAKTLETDILVPVVPKSLPNGLTTAPPFMKSIEFHIKGSKSAIKSLSQENLKYILDLSNAKTGVISIPVNQTLLSFPKGISVLKVTPSFVTVRIEREIKKILSVDISFSGKPAKGFDVEKSEVKPSSVMLKGPEIILESLNKILTKPIDLNGVSESFKKEVTLDLKEGITLISTDKLILAKIDIREKTGKKTISDIPVTGKNSSLKFDIQPPFVSIDINGPVIKIEALNKEKEISAYVDLDGLIPGTYELQAVISLPVEFTIIGIVPEKFLVTIKKK